MSKPDFKKIDSDKNMLHILNKYIENGWKFNPIHNMNGKKVNGYFIYKEYENEFSASYNPVIIYCE